MNQLDETLVMFGWTIVAVIPLYISWTFLAGRSDLLTGKNIFLLGTACFIGMSSVSSGSQGNHYAHYKTEDYQRFYLGVVTLYFAFSFFYTYVPIRSLDGSPFLRNWPTLSTRALMCLVFVSLGILILAFTIGMFRSLPGVTQFVWQVGQKGVVFGVVFAVAAWNKNRTNLVMIWMVVLVFFVSTVLAIRTGYGRRNLLAVFFSIPATMYWAYFRYESRQKVFGYSLVCFAVMFAAMTSYAAIRRIETTGQKRNIENSAKLVLGTIEQMFSDSNSISEFDVVKMAPRLGQNATECTLYCSHLFGDNGRLEPQPFHSLKFVVFNPIPRVIWPDKPQGLGYMLPKIQNRRNRMTWGPGIVGHGFHEGGIWMVAIFGGGLGIALNLFDRMLRSQPENPFLLGILAATAGHLFGFSRGDIGTFSIQIISVIILAFLLRGFANLSIGNTAMQNEIRRPIVRV